MSLNRVLYYSALTVALLCLAPAAGNAGVLRCAPVGTIQATATVIHPLGFTAPGDDFLTTRPVERSVLPQRQEPLEIDQWLLRFPSSSGLSIVVEGSSGEVDRFTLDDPRVLPGDIGAAPHMTQLDCCRLLNSLTAQDTECVVTLIYTEN